MAKRQQIENKFTNKDLRTMQLWDLDRKISVSLTKIAEFYDKFPHRIYVSYFGGKDSTAAVFIDTGLEYPEIREFVKTVDNVSVLYPVKYERKGRKYTRTNFKQVLKENGYPIISKEISQVIEEARRNAITGKYSYRIKRLNGELLDKNGNKSIYNCENWKFLMDAPFKISNRCCIVMKKNPAKKYERETGFKPIIGTMACESQARKTVWKIHGAKRPNSQPMSFWTEQDVLEYILRYDLQYASVYGFIEKDKKGKYHTTGCQRTGCVFCMYGCHLEKEPNRFQRLKETHPKLWEYCMKPWSDGGLGMKEVLEFIGVNPN